MKETVPIPVTIQKIKSKEILGKDLSREYLLGIVEYLRGIGQGTTTIAGFLGYSSRQIQRFLSEIREKNRFEFSEKFWGAYIGTLLLKQEAALDYLIRTYNDSQYSPEIRIVACSHVLKYLNVCTETLQSLGALPLQALKMKHKLYQNEQKSNGTYSEQTDMMSENWEAGCSVEIIEELKLLTPLQRDVIRLEIEKKNREAQEFIDNIVSERKDQLRRIESQNS